MRAFLKQIRLIFYFDQRLYSKFSQISTIYALSSGLGKCGVSIIRISGPHSSLVLSLLTKRKLIPQPRLATLAKLYSPKNGEILDSSIIIWFPGPKSFTGEDCCEFHVHGSVAVVNALFHALDTVPGVRMAQPGEFVKRAFNNGKLDLTEVEGLADLIKSETEHQRRAALRIIEGDVGELYKGWRDTLIKANLEMLIDFSEDQHIDADVAPSIHRHIAKLRSALVRFLADAERGRRLANGIRITIVGAPNVGKSSLFNLLCSRSLSIVSPLAGTTRDTVEASRSLSGYPVIYTDTAGIKVSDGPQLTTQYGLDKKSQDGDCEGSHESIEMEGMERAKRAVKESDVIIVVINGPDTLPLIDGHPDPWTYWMGRLGRAFTDYILPVNDVPPQDDEPVSHPNLAFERFLKSSKCPNSFSINGKCPRIIFVVNKADLLADHLYDFSHKCDTLTTNGNSEQGAIQSPHLKTDSESPNSNLVFVSCKKGLNIDRMFELLTDAAKTMCGDPTEGNPLVHSHRQLSHVNDCLTHIDNFSGLEFCERNYLFLARALQKASQALGYLTGDRAPSTDDLLDVIFRDFCIGK